MPCMIGSCARHGSKGRPSTMNEIKIEDVAYGEWFMLKVYPHRVFMKVCTNSAINAIQVWGTSEELQRHGDTIPGGPGRGALHLEPGTMIVPVDPCDIIS